MRTNVSNSPAAAACYAPPTNALHLTDREMRLQPRDTSQPSLNPQAHEFIPSWEAGTKAAAGASTGASRPIPSPICSNSAVAEAAGGGSVNTTRGGRRTGRPNGEEPYNLGHRNRQRGERHEAERRANRRSTRTRPEHNISATAPTAATVTRELTHSSRERPRHGRHGRRSVAGRGSRDPIEPLAMVPQSQDGRRFTSRWVYFAPVVHRSADFHHQQGKCV